MHRVTHSSGTEIAIAAMGDTISNAVTARDRIRGGSLRGRRLALGHGFLFLDGLGRGAQAFGAQTDRLPSRGSTATVPVTGRHLPSGDGQGLCAWMIQVADR